MLWRFEQSVVVRRFSCPKPNFAVEGVLARSVAHVQLFAFKFVFALAMLGSFDCGLAEVSSEIETAEWAEEHKLPLTPPHPRRQAHRPCDGFAPTDRLTVTSRPVPSPISPAGHALSNGLRAPLRC